MAERGARRALEPDASLVVAAVYEREIAASLERVWENVYDWEHLPWLHAQAFGAIERLDSGDWGWHAQVVLSDGSAAEIELVSDRQGGCYVARTLAGAGAPTEIWTRLEALSSDRVAIRVAFHVVPDASDRLARIGAAYVSLYTTLWDQDEEMMQTRERALMARPDALPESLDGSGDGPAARVDLGPLLLLGGQLPLVAEFGGRPFRIVDLDGELRAHAIECPHRLGPLQACRVQNGEIVCPWHGYRFNLRSGRSADGRGLRLARPPRVSVDSESGHVLLEAAANSL